MAPVFFGYIRRCMLLTGIAPYIPGSGKGEVKGEGVSREAGYRKPDAAGYIKCPGIEFGKSKNGYYIRAHRKPLIKTKDMIRERTEHSRDKNVRQVMQKAEHCKRGWLNCYGISEMKRKRNEWDGRLGRSSRTCIWEQWKKPRTKYRNPRKPESGRKSRDGGNEQKRILANGGNQGSERSHFK